MKHTVKRVLSAMVALLMLLALSAVSLPDEGSALELIRPAQRGETVSRSLTSDGPVRAVMRGGAERASMPDATFHAASGLTVVHDNARVIHRQAACVQEQEQTQSRITRITAAQPVPPSECQHVSGGMYHLRLSDPPG